MTYPDRDVKRDRDSEVKPSDVEVRQLDQLNEFEAAVDLLCTIWDADNAEDLVNASTLIALSMSGNYVAGAYLDGELVGVAVAWRGVDHLHSHIVGVHPRWQGVGLGYKIKRHEGEWALAQGFTTIRWTFDPLVRGNAHHNLAKLGGHVLAFHQNVYGRLNDGIGAGEETDRLLVEWSVPENGWQPPAGAASSFELFGLPVRRATADEVPEPVSTRLSRADGAVCLVATPDDIVRMRKDSPGLARTWSLAVRDAFQGALRDGFHVTGFTSDGCYVLRR